MLTLLRTRPLGYLMATILVMVTASLSADAQDGNAATPSINTTATLK